FALSLYIVLTMAFAHVAAGLMYPLTIGPYVLEETSKVTPIFIVSMVLITLLGVLLIAWRGGTGAADALLAVYLIQALLLARLSQRLYRVPFEVARLAKVVFALALGLAAALWVHTLTSHKAADWLLAPLFLAVLATVLAVLRFAEPSELAAIRAAAVNLRTRWRSA